MTDRSEVLNNAESEGTTSKIILGTFGSLAIFFLARCTFGFGRAVTLGWKSSFETKHPLSVRKADVQRLKEMLKMKRGLFISVSGGKGNGKSCLIDTALNRQFGVIKITVGNINFEALLSIFLAINMRY